MERTSGTIHRCFSLPDTADAIAIVASSSLGVLKVVVPKKSAVRRRPIAVD